MTIQSKQLIQNICNEFYIFYRKILPYNSIGGSHIRIEDSNLVQIYFNTN